MTSICVFGAGAIGGLMAAKLEMAGTPVTVVARGPHGEALRTRGLVLLSEGKETVTEPRVASDPKEIGPQDYLVLTLKAHSLLPARVALCFSGEMRAAFSRAVYDAEFAHGADISDTKVIEKILKSLGEEPAKIFEKVNTQAIKDALRTETEAAQKRKIFGAPAFVTEDGELFWGNDRLEAALEWAAR